MKARKHEGWSSTHCTKGRCRTFLDPGAGLQFVGERGKQERYCWKHWQELCKKQEKSPEKEGKE
jgi:hypothetical protein